MNASFPFGEILPFLTVLVLLVTSWRLSPTESTGGKSLKTGAAARIDAE